MINSPSRFLSSVQLQDPARKTMEPLLKQVHTQSLCKKSQQRVKSKQRKRTLTSNVAASVQREQHRLIKRRMSRFAQRCCGLQRHQSGSGPDSSGRFNRGRCCRVRLAAPLASLLQLRALQPLNCDSHPNEPIRARDARRSHLGARLPRAAKHQEMQRKRALIH